MPYQAWIARNAAWAPASQLVPFEELSQEDKDKDTVIVLKAMEAFKPFMPSAAATTLSPASPSRGGDNDKDKLLRLPSVEENNELANGNANANANAHADASANAHAHATADANAHGGGDESKPAKGKAKRGK